MGQKSERSVGENAEHFTEEDIQMRKIMMRCSTAHVIRGIEMKTMRHHDTTIRIAKIQNTDSTKFW